MTPDEAGLRVRALVSGLPGERGRKRPLFMAKVYQAYVDGSGTGAKDWFVLAGYIAPAKRWEAFSKEWKARLDAAGLPYFKMHERRQSSAEMEKIAFFYRVLEENDIGPAISIAVKVDELVKVVASTNWPPMGGDSERLKNPYLFAFKMIVIGLAANQQKLNLTEPVDFIFDNESEKALVLSGWENLLGGQPPDRRQLIGDTPIFRDDKTTMPLQAADLYAWWVRKWMVEEIGPGKQVFPWQPKTEIFRIHGTFREANFRESFAELLEPKNLADIFYRINGGGEKGEAVRREYQEWYKKKHGTNPWA